LIIRSINRIRTIPTSILIRDTGIMDIKATMALTAQWLSEFRADWQATVTTRAGLTAWLAIARDTQSAPTSGATDCRLMARSTGDYS